MYRNTLHAFGLLVVTFSPLACGNSSGGGSGGTGGATAGSGGSTGSGGAGGGGAVTPMSSCAAYCRLLPADCPDCANLSPVVTSCIAFCIAEKNCAPNSSIEDCDDYRCIRAVNNGGESLDTLSSGCQSATKAYFDCLATQRVICDVAAMTANQPGDCVAQATALGSCQ